MSVTEYRPFESKSLSPDRMGLYTLRKYRKKEQSERERKRRIQMVSGGNVRVSVFGYTQRDIYAHVHPLALNHSLVRMHAWTLANLCTREHKQANTNWNLLTCTNFQTQVCIPIGFTMSAVAPWLRILPPSNLHQS